MNRRNALLGAVIVLCLGAAGTLTARWAANQRQESSDFPDGTLWICLECGQEFVKTVHELAEIDDEIESREGPGAPRRVPCPACSSVKTVRALRCPHCERFFERPPKNTGRPTCPHCNQPMPPLIKGLGG